MAGAAVPVSVDQKVATITLNRPEVLNALDATMARELVRAVETCAADEAVRAVILTGAGRGFCAGGDMKAAWEHVRGGGDPRTFFAELTMLLHRAIVDLRLMEKPVIAAINGSTGGAGMSLAGACDLRLAAEGAKFRQAYTSIGLVPDGGWTVIVAQILGYARASELVLLDPVFDAPKAYEWGFVHEVVPADALAGRARDLARQLASGATSAYGGAKALLNAAFLPALETQLERERQRIMTQGASQEFLDRLVAFVERRGTSATARPT